MAATYVTATRPHSNAGELFKFHREGMYAG